MVVIRGTQPHFIRCIKPNEQKAAFLFEPVQVLQQVPCRKRLRRGATTDALMPKRHGLVGPAAADAAASVRCPRDHQDQRRRLPIAHEL